MHHFAYSHGVLHAEGVSLEIIAEQAGTPVYVYATATLVRHVQAFRRAFAPRKVGIYYAMKANANLAVLKTLARAGAGADTVSEGEIRKALAAGVAPGAIVFSGVGKTAAELAFAVEAGIHQVNVETARELDMLDAIARARGKRQSIVFRVNPAVGAGGHDKITTGSEANKFGVSAADVPALYARASEMAGVEPLGLAVHIGSQIMDLAPLRAAFERVRELAVDLRRAGHQVQRIDLGGGLGVHYSGEAGMAEGAGRIEAYAHLVKEVFEPAEILTGSQFELGFEPGRLIVANAGVLLARVTGFNERRARRFVVLDAGMNDLVRPAMYQSHHEIVPVREPPAGARPEPVDVVGPICESSDVFAEQRPLPPLAAGDLVAFLSAGAYGATMASTYNLRPLVAEALVDGERWAVVRPRQTYDELIGQDRMAPWLTNA
jgi:diaminopimelate decarboxylase